MLLYQSEGTTMAHSNYLSGLNTEQREQLERRLLERQGGRCFICDELIDLLLHKGQLDIDHIDPLIKDGLDSENNFALTHAHCNRSKGASNLEVARRLAEFEKLQQEAKKHGQRGADLGDVLEKHGGAKAVLRLRREDDRVELSFAEVGDNTIRTFPLLHDKLSGMDTFFASVPLEYLHHDDRINPRPIGSNIRGLIEEFLSGNPQLHVGLGWWTPEQDGAGPVKVFDGQHKAAAQILLGIRELPVRIFVQPDTNVLLDANTNAGGKLRQVAFDVAIMRHLGSTLYLERINQYRKMRGWRGTTTPSQKKTLSDSSEARAERWPVTSLIANATPSRMTLRTSYGSSLSGPAKEPNARLHTTPLSVRFIRSFFTRKRWILLSMKEWSKGGIPVS